MNSLDRTLEWMATREVDEAAVSDAQRKLEALIASRAPRTRRVPGARRWLAAAASAAALALAMLWLPLTPTPALAFSAIQQNLRDFQTLRFVMDERVNGQRVMQTRVVVTRDGNARTEVGDEVTVIVNSAQKQVLLLMNSARSAHLMPLSSRVEKAEGLEWLDEVRRFQGVATRLPQPRVIDGHTAYGWKLSAGGMDLLIWATGEGVPLEMTMGKDEQLQFDFRFEMNVPLAADLFSTRVPEGYTLGPSED